DARTRAREVRLMLENGIDRVADRREKKAALAADVAKAVTFEWCAKRFIEGKSAEWRNTKHAAQWTSTLEQYAYPVIGKMLVRDVELPHVLRILEPIWEAKTETASRVRSRIDNILDWATVHGYRTGPSPARWKGHLDKLLAAPSKVQRVEHHAALDYRQAGAFMRRLRAQAGMAARALEFAILTAARSGEVRGATWQEIDFGAAVWTVPPERMKAKKEHRVPLPGPAIELLKRLPREADNDLVFPAPRGGTLSDMSLLAVLRRMSVDATPHGFRSTFRDWAGETTAYPREVIEHALAHQLKDKAEAAYARGTLFDKRRRLMAEWARFLDIARVEGSGEEVGRGVAELIRMREAY
ncbi:MAG: tyrosine-type recombinase/integrase, partial [Thiobacillus sp.]|nr:tyrosine-type recombinase/integrase [Thiobacillus sp.]